MVEGPASDGVEGLDRLFGGDDMLRRGKDNIGFDGSWEKKNLENRRAAR